MKHVFRFIGEILSEGHWQVSDPAELEHARKVLRLNVGDSVEVFDGQGAFGVGAVELLSSNSMEVVVEQTQRQKPPLPRIVLAIGALKPGDLDDILPPLVELGVDEVWVFHQEGTEKFRLAEKAVQRWERIVLGACKQSKRAWLPVVRPFQSLHDLLNEPSVQSSVRLVLQPGESQALHRAGLGGGQVVAVVGGERGLIASELDMLVKAKFVAVHAGGNILRARTAAVAAAAILGSRRDDGIRDEVVDSH